MSELDDTTAHQSRAGEDIANIASAGVETASFYDGAPPPDDNDWSGSTDDIAQWQPPSPLSFSRSRPKPRAAAQSRAIPYDLEAERAVLSNGFINTERFSGILSELHAEDFFERRNAVIFHAMRKLAIDNAPIDPISVNSQLQADGTVDQSGGLNYLFELSGSGSGVAVEHYAKRVSQLAHMRKILMGLHKAQTYGMGSKVDPDDFIERVQNEVVAELEKVTGSGSTVHISEIAQQVNDQIIELSKRDNKNSLTGVTTGFRDINQMLLGFHPTDMFVLAARPSMGKTALALNFALNVSKEKHVVLIFSLEMGREQLVQRLLSQLARVELTAIRQGELKDDAETNLTNATAELENMKLYIDDTPSLSCIDVRARAKRVALKEQSLDLVVVDYLQLMRGTGGAKQSREQEIGEISRSLKGLAKELHCTVLALAQLNRGIERREDKVPRMSDLRESGAIEQDADIIAFIDRPIRYNEKADPNGATLHIVKHRAGETGKVDLYFEGQYTRFLTRDRHTERFPVERDGAN